MRILQQSTWLKPPLSDHGITVSCPLELFMLLLNCSLAFFIGNYIDVGIEILPMKTLQSQMSSGPSYYEGELYNVVRQGRGIPAVPLVIIGIEP
jgi:hypothetical protein